MSRREAALILSIRESSTRNEIKDSHKRLMMLNHPDAGGSTYIASKINEAKELLMLTAPDEKL
jgi:DnaJ family protein C protein 19